MANKINVDASVWSKLQYDEQIKELVRQSLTGVQKYGFIPVGDLELSDMTGAEKAAEWNASMKELLELLEDPTKLLGANVSLDNILNADAKGTEEKSYLDPIPFVNKINKTYLQARTDELEMNVNHMDYTNEREVMTEEVVEEYLELAKLCDINGDGYIGADDAQLIMEICYAGKITQPEKVILPHSTNASIGQGDPRFFVPSMYSHLDYVPTSLLQLGKTSYPSTRKNDVSITTDEAAFCFGMAIGTMTDYKVLPIYLNQNGPYAGSIIGQDTYTDMLRNIARFDEKMTTNGSDVRFNYQLALHMITCIATCSSGTNAYVSYEVFSKYLKRVSEYEGIRLLMPQYARRVEVEDLNKNFWVIAQVLDALSEALFGRRGVFKFTQKIINELGEIWQNDAYIWNLLASLIEDLTNIKLLFGIGQVNEVYWTLSDKKTPNISCYDKIQLNNFSIVLKNQYGTRTVSNIISSTDRVNPVSGTSRKYTTTPIYTSGKYDIDKTKVKLCQELGAKSVAALPLCFLSVNSDETKVAAQFKYDRKYGSYTADECLAAYLNENLDDYFRVIPNFTIVVYDSSTYEYYAQDNGTHGGIKVKSIKDDGSLVAIEESSSERIFFIPNNRLYNGETIKINLSSLCLQDNIPKRETSDVDNSTSEYWDNPEYRFYKTTYFIKPSDNESFVKNNKIEINYKAKDATILYSGYFNVTLFRTDFIEDFITHDMIITSETTLSTFPYKSITETPIYHTAQREGMFVVYGSPGYKGGNAIAENSATKFINSSLTGSAPCPYVMDGNKGSYGTVFSDELLTNLKNNGLLNIIYSYPHYRDIQSSGGSNYPSSYTFVKCNTHPNVYDSKVKYARTYLENLSYSQTRNGVNSIRAISKTKKGSTYHDYAENHTSDLSSSIKAERDGKQVAVNLGDEVGNGYINFNFNDLPCSELLLLYESTIGDAAAESGKALYKHDYTRMPRIELYGELDIPNVKYNFS